MKRAAALKQASLAILGLQMMIGTTAALAMDPRFAASLKRLDPETRLEQVCDLEAMNRIGRDAKPFHPDRAKTDVLSHPVHVGSVLKGSGGAFRSKGKWYAFSFTCKASPDHMKVLAFSCKIGNSIPESKWASLGLWR
jgi:hypothetical protein